MLFVNYVLKDKCYAPGTVRSAIMTGTYEDSENLDLTVFINPKDIPWDHPAMVSGLLLVENVSHDENKEPGTWHNLTVSTSAPTPLPAPESPPVSTSILPPASTPKIPPEK